MMMHLTLLLPFRVFGDIQNVKRIVVETRKGAFGLLPQRLDCVAALVPGIFTYETDREYFIAVDEGVMVKAGQEVLVSVRNAIQGASLDELQDSVEKQFKQLDEDEKNIRSVMARMEGGFLLSLEKFRQQ
ncbi:F0F1 ATP synthase subunit epsilon [Neolewinella antarctica]|uniref:ATP synthase epsilon chain n=1 Tax=Neolewinella antarctica TaxID=442734 RepID=A0ABX0XDI6_9BACT|nr:F0F1 ATP synthase subunit epsilon [Neolewinella antarctica]NJC26954.1 F-type H+-transporting ATPase subunit epsilon [Neolewinella antarctica]